MQIKKVNTHCLWGISFKGAVRINGSVNIRAKPRFRFETRLGTVHITWRTEAPVDAVISTHFSSLRVRAGIDTWTATLRVLHGVWAGLGCKKESEKWTWQRDDKQNFILNPRLTNIFHGKVMQFAMSREGQRNTGWLGEIIPFTHSRRRQSSSLVVSPLRAHTDANTLLEFYTNSL